MSFMWCYNRVHRKYLVAYYDEPLYEIQGPLYDISDELDEASQHFRDSYILHRSVWDSGREMSNGMLYFRLNPLVLAKLNADIHEQENRLKEAIRCNTCKDLPVSKHFCLDCIDLKFSQQQSAKSNINDAKADAVLLRISMRPDFIRQIKRIFPDSKLFASDIDYYL